MMTNFMKTINMNANSEIDDVLVMTMWANIVENGKINFNKNIQNTELYLANLEQCDADYAAFEAAVRELV